MLQLLLNIPVFAYLSAFLRNSLLHFQNSGIEEAMGGSFASTFAPLAVGRKHSGQESGFRTEPPTRGVPHG